MKQNYYNKILLVGLLILLIGASIVPGINTETKSISNNGGTSTTGGPTFNTPDDDWNYWSSPPNMYSNVSGNIGIGTTNPTNKLHIVASSPYPIVNIEQTGSARGLRVNSTSACAIWVDHSGNHGVRITQAHGNGVLVTNTYQSGLYVTNAGIDGVHIVQAAGWAGYFNGTGYFGGNVGIGTETPASMLEVAGIIHSTNGGFKFPDGTIQTSAATGGGTGNTLDQAYDQGGPGAGRTITADSGAVNIDGPDGLTVNGNVGINTTNPSYELEVKGTIQSDTYNTQEIFFQNNGNQIWKIFGDETNLYLTNLLTGTTYRFVLFKTSSSTNLNIVTSNSVNLEQEIINLRAENDALKERIEALEQLIIK